TNPGAINNLVRIAAPEPGAVYGKEVLKAVLIDLHHMGRFEASVSNNTVGIFQVRKFIPPEFNLLI
ncbi:MAG TPA: hypothetical protein VF318_01330, partial [Dehalococcoidales bacterium]